MGANGQVYVKRGIVSFLLVKIQYISKVSDDFLFKQLTGTFHMTLC